LEIEREERRVRRRADCFEPFVRRQVMWLCAELQTDSAEQFLVIADMTRAKRGVRLGGSRIQRLSAALSDSRRWQIGLLVEATESGRRRKQEHHFIGVIYRNKVGGNVVGGRCLRYFAAFVTASVLAYVPLAVAFTPSAWLAFGPFGFQLSRPLHYAVYFFAGVGIGACGIERGLFAPDGALVRRWAVWLVAALGSLLVWMSLTALTMAGPSSTSLGLQILDYLSFVLACFSSCFFVLGLVLRFSGRRLGVLDGLKRDAFGMYLVHYVFVVWLQYALLGAGLAAVVKGSVVFGGTLLLSWGTIAVVRQIPPAAQVIGAGRARGAAAS